MKKTYWKNAAWFLAGTFLGGYLIGFVGSLLGRK